MWPRSRSARVCRWSAQCSYNISLALGRALKEIIYVYLYTSVLISALCIYVLQQHLCWLIWSVVYAYAKCHHHWVTGVQSISCACGFLIFVWDGNHHCFGMPLCWKAFSDNTTPHQQRWAGNNQMSKPLFVGYQIINRPAWLLPCSIPCYFIYAAGLK